MIVIFGIACVIVFFVGLSDARKRSKAKKNRDPNEEQQRLLTIALLSDLNRRKK